ncbi:MAG: T9SS type A sorting domain-containing protein [Saprospiraceae bacterium]
MLRTIIFLVLLSSSFSLFAQEGCTDPVADNYDAAAVTNDGSCTYSYSPVQIANLPGSLEECSGLAFLEESGLWTHNDNPPNGNEDKLYRIDTVTGQILQTVLIATADNVDWEDLAQSEDYLYIGDFGNNSGGRMDLKVYRVKRSDLSANIVNAELIEFSFSDQTVFIHNNNDHNFDCEAFFFHKDSLHLFSKDWQDNRTRHYVLPATPGTHTAQLRGSFDVGGLITGADINEDGVVTLLGYVPPGNTFMWLFYDYADTDYFSGNQRYVALGSGVFNGQVEGICFRNKDYGYIGSEKFSVLNPKLLSFSIEKFTDFNVGTTPSILVDFGLTVYPNPVGEELQIDFPEMLSGTIQLTLFNSVGQSIHQESLQDANGKYQLNLANLTAGWYQLSIQNGRQFQHIPLLKL